MTRKQRCREQREKVARSLSWKASSADRQRVCAGLWRRRSSLRRDDGGSYTCVRHFHILFFVHVHVPQRARSISQAIPISSTAIRCAGYGRPVVAQSEYPQLGTSPHIFVMAAKAISVYMRHGAQALTSQALCGHCCKTCLDAIKLLSPSRS